MTIVSFQGERGAYSEAAAITFFEDKGTIEAVPHKTFAEALESTTSGRTNWTILPVENSIEGSVGESYDLLYSTQLTVAGEIYHKIEHCLIGTAKSIKDVKTIYSHPQALGQCRRFIEGHGMRAIPTYDTAGSVKIVKNLEDPTCACIASKEAARIYEMPVITQDIANDSRNHTRFLLLSYDGTSATGSDKTSIILSILHEQGSLYRIIKRFHASGVNLTKIESRPTKAWEYNFYVDFEGHTDDSHIAQMLDGMKADTLFLKVLGAYPAARSLSSVVNTQNTT